MKRSLMRWVRWCARALHITGYAVILANEHVGHYLVFAAALLDTLADALETEG
jgi:hypothetical protein